MNAKETSTFAMLVKVAEFGKTHRSLVSILPAAIDAFASISDSVEQLKVLTVRKMCAARDSTCRTRDELIEQLRAIHRTARVIAETSPGIEEPFAFRRRRSDEEWVVAGRVAVREAHAEKARFVALGMRATFVDELERQVEALAAAIEERDASEADQFATRIATTEALSSALAAVRQLDVIVTNRFGEDPGLMAMWQFSRGVDLPRPVSHFFPPTGKAA